MITKISAVYIENFKRINQVNFNPDEIGITIIGGNNRQGKTSVLDAIMWGLGGAKFAPSTPNNLNGHGDAEIRIELNNGIIVERKGKNGGIKVIDSTGKKAGQELLNEVISVLALNLPKFMESNDKDKALILLETLGIKDKLAELDNREKILYDERTEIGRVALALKKHADEMPYYYDAPSAEISAATIIEKQTKAIEKNKANDAVRAENLHLQNCVAESSSQLETYDAETASAGNAMQQQHANKLRELDLRRKNILNRIEELNCEIRRLESENNTLTNEYHDFESQAKINYENFKRERLEKRTSVIRTISDNKLKLAESEKLVAALPENIDLSIFKADIEALEMQNAKFRANLAHDKASAEAKSKDKEYALYTEMVEGVRRERMELLASVKMPLPGLTIKDGLIYYHGQRWDCMSGSEKLIVGASIVRAVNPACGFVLMDKLEQMDLATLSDFDEWLKKENLQVIATRVSTGDECAILIEDGKIADK